MRIPKYFFGLGVARIFRAYNGFIMKPYWSIYVC